MLLGKQSVVHEDEASWYTNLGVLHFSQKLHSSFIQWGYFGLNHQAFHSLSVGILDIVCFVCLFDFCFSFFVNA